MNTNPPSSIATGPNNIQSSSIPLLKLPIVFNPPTTNPFIVVTPVGNTGGLNNNNSLNPNINKSQPTVSSTNNTNNNNMNNNNNYKNPNLNTTFSTNQSSNNMNANNNLNKPTNSAFNNFNTAQNKPPLINNQNQNTNIQKTVLLPTPVSNFSNNNAVQNTNNLKNFTNPNINPINISLANDKNNSPVGGANSPVNSLPKPGITPLMSAKIPLPNQIAQSGNINQNNQHDRDFLTHSRFNKK